nr:hypothetical protein [Candidatus Sigynarchaeota archaeon]
MLSNSVQTHHEPNPENLKAKRRVFLDEAKKALFSGDLRSAARLFREISILCSDLGDHEMAMEYFTRAEKITRLLKSTQDAILRA